MPLEILRGGEADQAERADEALLRASAPRPRLIAETETAGGGVRNRLGLLSNIFKKIHIFFFSFFYHRTEVIIYSLNLLKFTFILLSIHFYCGLSGTISCNKQREGWWREGAFVP